MPYKHPERIPRANWSKRRGVCRVLEHSKIIGARSFTKIKVDHEIIKFRMFLTYRTL